MSKPNGGKGGSPMTPSRAAAIQSATAKGNGGQVSAGSFAARATAAAAKNITAGVVSSTPSGKSGN